VGGTRVEGFIQRPGDARPTGRRTRLLVTPPFAILSFGPPRPAWLRYSPRDRPCFSQPPGLGRRWTSMRTRPSSRCAPRPHGGRGAVEEAVRQAPDRWWPPRHRGAAPDAGSVGPGAGFAGRRAEAGRGRRRSVRTAGNRVEAEPPRAADGSAAPTLGPQVRTATGLRGEGLSRRPAFRHELVIYEASPWPGSRGTMPRSRGCCRR
jgi:hypothetical protein